MSMKEATLLKLNSWKKTMPNVILVILIHSMGLAHHQWIKTCCREQVFFFWRRKEPRFFMIEKKTSRAIGLYHLDNHRKKSVLQAADPIKAGFLWTEPPAPPKWFANPRLPFLHNTFSPCPPMSLKPPDTSSDCDPEPYTPLLDCWQAKWSR